MAASPPNMWARRRYRSSSRRSKRCYSRSEARLNEVTRNGQLESFPDGDANAKACETAAPQVALAEAVGSRQKTVPCGAYAQVRTCVITPANRIPLSACG